MADINDMMIPGYNPAKQQQPSGMEGWPTEFPKPIVGLERKGVITDINNEPLFGALDAILNIRLKGYKLSIIADETGKQENDVMTKHNHLMEKFAQAGIMSIDGFLFSVNNDTKDPYVKPQTGMFKKAIEMNPSIKWNEGYYVGASVIDMKAAVKIGAKPIFLKTNEHETKKLYSFPHRDLLKKVEVMDSLLEFASSLK